MSLWLVGEQASDPTRSGRCVGEEDAEGSAGVGGINNGGVVGEMVGHGRKPLGWNHGGKGRRKGGGHLAMLLISFSHILKLI